MNWITSHRKIKAIEELATTRGNTGGLLKRIDENRELLELLQQEFPCVLRRAPWVAGWIEGNDQFFVQLDEILGDVTKDRHLLDDHYPRPWPGERRHSQPDLPTRATVADQQTLAALESAIRNSAKEKGVSYFQELMNRRLMNDSGRDSYFLKALAQAEMQAGATSKHATHQEYEMKNTRQEIQSDVSQHRKELDFEGNESLKSLVETMHETGRFEVFCVSKGRPNIFNSRAPIISFWADAESARALSNLLIDELGCSNIPGNLWCLDVGFPRVLPHRVVGHLHCCKFDEDAKSFWKSVWRFILKRQEVDRNFSILRELVVLNFQKGNQIERRENESHDQHD